MQCLKVFVLSALLSLIFAVTSTTPVTKFLYECNMTGIDLTGAILQENFTNLNLAFCDNQTNRLGVKSLDLRDYAGSIHPSWSKVLTNIKDIVFTDEAFIELKGEIEPAFLQTVERIILDAEPTNIDCLLHVGSEPPHFLRDILPSLLDVRFIKRVTNSLDRYTNRAICGSAVDLELYPYLDQDDINWLNGIDGAARNDSTKAYSLPIRKHESRSISQVAVSALRGDTSSSSAPSGDGNGWGWEMYAIISLGCFDLIAALAFALYVFIMRRKWRQMAAINNPLKLIIIGLRHSRIQDTMTETGTGMDKGLETIGSGLPTLNKCGGGSSEGGGGAADSGEGGGAENGESDAAGAGEETGSESDSASGVGGGGGEGGEEKKGGKPKKTAKEEGKKGKGADKKDGKGKGKPTKNKTGTADKKKSKPSKARGGGKKSSTAKKGGGKGKAKGGGGGAGAKKKSKPGGGGKAKGGGGKKRR